MEKKIVVVITYKPFYFFTKICLASIRYYYPSAELYIVKDELAGKFSTVELEQALNVKILDLGTNTFGWSAAKVHLLASTKFLGQRLISLDCDIVFVGRFLDDLYEKTKDSDFVVNPEFYETPYEGNVPRHYYKFDELIKFDPDFVFPGYVFNGGQAIIKTGILTREILASYFDLNTFPYYKRRDILPQADQSLLNYLLPKLEQLGKVKITPVKFMLWSDEDFTQTLDIKKIKQGDVYPYLIHWAGVLRVSHLDKMTRADILHFFEDYYYSKVPLGGLKKRFHTLVAKSDFLLQEIYRKSIKSILGK